MLISSEALEKLAATYPRVEVVTGRPTRAGGAVPWEAVFRSPTRAAYKAFRSRAHNPAAKADAQELLARECVVWVSTSPGASATDAVKLAFDALLEDYPAVPEACADALGRLAGIGAEESGK